MLILVHASPTTLARHRHPNLGLLSSPRRFYPDVEGWKWAADNDAYSDWDADRYRRMLQGIDCDSVDGTSFSWFRDRWLDDFLAHAAAPTQLLVEETTR